MGRRLDNARSLYMEGIQDGNYVHAIETYAGDRYTQHSTPVRDGKAGFIEFFADFIERNPQRDIRILRGFEDGRYVFVHALQILNGGRDRWVTADIFDTDDQARLIEHWDVIAEVVDDSVSGHSQVDGPTEPTDLALTEQNKALVRSYTDDVLTTGRFELLDDYLSADGYVEHDPRVSDGIEGVRGYHDDLAADGQTVRYRRVHNLIGCGSFVAVLAEVDMAGVDTAVIDLWRVDDGRIAEHWEVKEPIAPRDQWVNSGKF